jgi:predicted dehydrogenase
VDRNRDPLQRASDSSTRIFVDDGSAHGGFSAKGIEFLVVDQYEQQGVAFSRAIREEGALTFELEDVLMNMRTLDAIRRSETSMAWEEV